MIEHRLFSHALSIPKSACWHRPGYRLRRVGSAEICAGRLVVVTAIAAVLLCLVGGYCDAFRRRGYPMRAAVFIPIVDAAILGLIVFALRAFALLVLVVLVQVVECGRSGQEDHLLLGRHAWT